ncbi:PAS domain S-box protein [Corallococcus llansteffanensis]|uniref:histidine kinase n=1 Tax=Corallococcus llansteffanensis TaxID=2316731 RepID=A0A3A8P1T5_9BACT|nr:PAS domain S-box protein [Corallococcus llansteffanensis]
MSAPPSDTEQALRAEVERLRARLREAGLEEGPPTHAFDRQQMAVLFQQASVGISQLDLEGTLVLVNQRFCDLVQRSREDVVGRSLLELTHPEERERGAALSQRLLETEEPFAVESRHARPDGGTVWVHHHVSLARDASGRPLFAVCVSRDVTQSRGAEERLRVKREQLRLAQEAGGIGVFTLDLATNLLTVTPEFCRLYGVPRADTVPATVIESLALEEDRHRVSNARTRASGQVIPSVEYRIRKPDTGDVRWISRRASLVYDEDGRPVQLIGVTQDVTERRLAEDALREANERVRLALDSDVVIGTWVWDVPANRVIADERFARSFSLNALQAREGLPIDLFVASIHPEDRPGVEALIAQTLQSGGPYRTEYRVRQWDGVYRWVEASGHCEFTPAGKPLRFPGVLVNVDERKRAELRQAALIQMGDRLRDAQTPDAAALVAMEVVGRFLGVARAGYGAVDATHELVTLPPGWLSGPGIRSIAGVHRFRDYGAFLADLMHGETVAIADVQKDARTAHGVEALRRISVRALCNVPLMEHGRLVALLYFHDVKPREWTAEELEFTRDVADRVWAAIERLRALAELKQANETLEQRVAQRTRERDRVWNVSQDLLVVGDLRDGRFISVNPAWTRMLGWTEGELLGRTSEWMEAPDDYARSREEVSQLAGGRPTMHFESAYRCKTGGHRRISWTAVPVPEDGVLYASGRDVTEQRQTEDQLRQAQKMEAVGKLTGGVAHDFNNLLQIVGGNLQLLQRDVADNERGLQRVRTALGAVERGARLSGQLLAFSRRQPLEPRSLSLGRLVRGMDDLLRRALGEDVEVETVISGGLWNTLADPHQLENVILNLAINARDAMRGHGKLTLELSNASLDDHYAQQHPDVMAGAYVLLAVSDTGGGMTREVLERAFEPFFTTKPEGRGTGLGLSMVYGFVKQSGGHVKIYSEVGHGTTVKVYLPRAFQAEAPVLEVVTGPVEGGQETILAVEDDADVRATVVELLTELGYRVLRAVDGQSALSILKSGVAVDLLFTDVVMPGPVRSPELARQARLIHPDIEVLFTSGYTENAIVHGGRLDPGVHLLSKPYRREDLARKVRALLDQRKQRLETPAPPREPRPEPEPRTELPATQESAKRMHVLLVEDDADIRESASELLGLLGHAVMPVASAEEARVALAAGPFDVLFTDVTLPGMSGVELAREVALRKPAMRIIIASGHGRAALDGDPRQWLGVVVLPKPYALPQIEQALAQVAAVR